MKRIIGNIIAGLFLPLVFALAMATAAHAQGQVCFVKGGSITHCVPDIFPGTAYVYL